jgi:hypothetical protein
MFCTYLTTYSGNKLPPFYIGSTSILRIQRGYAGSVLSKEYCKIWKSERSTNPHLFKTKIISTHETRKEAFIKEHMLQVALKAIDSPMYINKAFAQSKLHMTGRKHSPESRQKMSASHIGRKHTEKTKQKISAAHLGKTFSKESKLKMSQYASTRPKEHLSKIGVASKNRSTETLMKLSEYASNRPTEHANKISQALKGKRLSEEHKAKLSQSKRGKPKSEEWKQSRRGPKTQEWKEARNKAMMERKAAKDCQKK